ncbi:MAG: hypothetical protein R6V53_07430 [Candidatus Woesearchaeota archaeon]
MKNYHELVRNLRDNEPEEVGQAIAEAVLSNARDHLDLYFNLHVKEFKNKESGRIFTSLERVLEQDAPSDDDLEEVYETVAGKTTKVVRQINFVYDALNFFATRESLPDFYPVLFQQISLLGNQRTAKEARGIRPDGPLYQLEKSTKRSQEYDFFVRSLRNYLRREYRVPLR